MRLCNLKNKLIFFVFFQRFVNAVGGVLFGAIVALKYNAADATGIYFMFSIALVFIVFEAGFPVMIVQRLSSDPDNKNEYIDHYYSCILFLSCLLFVFLIIVGFLYSENQFQMMAWFALSILVPLLMVRSTIQSFYEGRKELEKIAFERMLQAIIAYLLLIVSLLNNLGVWAVPSYYFSLVVIPIIINIFKRNYTSLYGISGNNGLLFLRFSKKRFFADVRWQYKLLIQSVSNYFSSNFWIVGLSFAGYYAVTPIVGFSNQIIFAVTGFSTMLFSTRLPLLSEAYYNPDKSSYRSLLKSIWKESYYVFILFSFISISSYLVIPELLPNYSERFGSLFYVWPYVFIFFLTFYVAAVTIIENSKGFDDFTRSHIVKIILSIFFVSLFFFVELQDYVPHIFLIYWALVACVFKLFSLIRDRNEGRRKCTVL